MIEITQFERKTQSVLTGTEPVKRGVNAGDPPHRYMIGIYQSTPHIKAMLIVVADLRSGHRSSKITSLAHISKHGRRKTEENYLCTNIEGSHES
jgi:hypothetical protein